MKNKYPSYTEDNTLKLKVVKTVSGVEEYAVNCRKIGKNYFIKNKDIFYFEEENGTKAWINVKNLYFDYEVNEYKRSVEGMLYGIVEIKDVVAQHKLGYFSPNPAKNCYLDNYVCLDVNALNIEKHIEDISIGFYYTIADLSVARRKECITKRAVANFVGNSYNSDDDPEKFKELTDEISNRKIKISKNARFAGRYLKKSFGLELETSMGSLPSHLLHKYGLIICKDGSLCDQKGLYPPEFVTVPLTGEKGIQLVTEFSPELAKRCEIDIKCSLHTHIGGINVNREFIVTLFILCTKIQDEIFKMFPYYKTQPAGVKAKNYCKKLPNILSRYGEKNYKDFINNTYVDIYKFMTAGHFDSKNMGRKHNPFGKNKWDIKTRYYWINFANIFFSKRNTAEFRLHTPTLNSDKIINWLFICNAIIEFAENYKLDCLSTKPISLDEVLNFYGRTYNTNYTKKLSQNLIAYVNERKAYFQKDYKNGDYLSAKELLEDKDFKFPVINIL